MVVKDCTNKCEKYKWHKIDENLTEYPNDLQPILLAYKVLGDEDVHYLSILYWGKGTFQSFTSHTYLAWKLIEPYDESEEIK